MRDLIVTENITLDGVIEATEGWFNPARDDAEVDQSDVEAALQGQSAGRTRPTAARTSRAPMALTEPALKSSAHPPRGVATIFSLGRISLPAPPARKTTASSPAMIHRVRFMSFSLQGCRRLRFEAGVVEAAAELVVLLAGVTGEVEDEQVHVVS
jgi:hypothetical protein